MRTASSARSFAPCGRTNRSRLPCWSIPVRRSSGTVLDIRKALKGFVQEMSGRDEMALIGFGERPTVLTNYTSDPEQLEDGIGKLFARRGSGAYALDAIVDASRSLRGREGARHVIVLITTEGPEFSNRYHEQVLDELRKSATLQSFVLTRRVGVALDDARRERELTMAKGTIDTGGRREHLLTSMALGDRLKDLANELKNQYRIDYSRPSMLIPPEKIDVGVKREGLTVRAPRVLSSVRTGTLEFVKYRTFNLLHVIRFFAAEDSISFASRRSLVSSCFALMTHQVSVLR